jgi:MarR family 2-MHQ and catechol resistance regulon transcriptional repressor
MTGTTTARTGRGLDREAEAIQAALADLVRVYQFRDRERICCHDVSVTQCYALEAILRDGPLTLNALAAALYLDKSTTSRVVDALERKGYVVRGPHPDDGRAVRIAATPAGRRLYAAIQRDLVAETRALLEGFAPDTRAAMLELLRSFGRAAAARAGVACCTPS